MSQPECSLSEASVQPGTSQSSYLPIHTSLSASRFENTGEKKNAQVGSSGLICTLRPACLVSEKN